jgi:DNA (cytosine-5)-methyltransferase 1
MIRLTSLELFSGAGGLAKGLSLAGFEHVGLVERNKHACMTLSATFGEALVSCEDVRRFDLGAVGEVDLIAGGPPCQPFSLGGKHAAQLDERDMFPSAIGVVKRLTPKVFIFENVKGLLRTSFKEYFEYILLRLTYPSFDASERSWGEQLLLLRSMRGVMPEYHVHFKLLNAANYGVPQERERVIIVGVRQDLCAEWSFPEETHSSQRLLWDMYVTGEYWERHCVPSTARKMPDAALAKRVEKLRVRFGSQAPAGLPWLTIRDCLAEVPDPLSEHGIMDHIFRDGARIYPGHVGSCFDWPSKTIKAGDHGVPGGENMIRFLDGSVRYLTVYEAKLVQTFPCDFMISGAWGEAMRQIGNAVPVLLASVLGVGLRELLVSGSPVAAKAETRRQLELF